MMPQVPNPNVPLAMLLCCAAYTDNPDQQTNGVYNIETAVAAIHTNYYPLCKVVWSSNQTADGNYAYIAVTPSNEYFLAIRGSLPFEVNGQFVFSWPIFYNWFKEDFNVFEQKPWQYCSGGSVSEGSCTAFSNLEGAIDIMGSKQSAYTYLLNNAVHKGYPVYITGHSLGGNIAATYASYFMEQIQSGSLNGKNENYLYTFAGPAAGNQAFVTDLQAKYPGDKAYHYAIEYDIIPQFPVVSNIAEMVAWQYSPSPLATAISGTFLDITGTLNEALLAMSAAIEASYWIEDSSAYTQSDLVSLPYSLASSYQANTLEDWLQQAAFQHTAIHYLFAFIFGDDAQTIASRLTPRMTKSPTAYLPDGKQNLATAGPPAQPAA